MIPQKRITKKLMTLPHACTNNPKRILIVDDEPRITSLVQFFFNRSGNYNVRAENVSSQALTSAEQFQPDLILMDIDMPGLDGGKLARRLMDHPGLSSVPIIFLSGIFSRNEVQQRDGVMGGFPCIAKPVCGHEILERVEECLAAVG